VAAGPCRPPRDGPRERPVPGQRGGAAAELGHVDQHQLWLRLGRERGDARRGRVVLQPGVCVRLQRDLGLLRGHNPQRALGVLLFRLVRGDVLVALARGRNQDRVQRRCSLRLHVLVPGHVRHHSTLHHIGSQQRRRPAVWLRHVDGRHCGGRLCSERRQWVRPVDVLLADDAGHLLLPPVRCAGQLGQPIRDRGEHLANQHRQHVLHYGGRPVRLLDFSHPVWRRRRVRLHVQRLHDPVFLREPHKHLRLVLHQQLLWRLRGRVGHDGGLLRHRLRQRRDAVPVQLHQQRKYLDALLLVRVPECAVGQLCHQPRLCQQPARGGRAGHWQRRFLLHYPVLVRVVVYDHGQLRPLGIRRQCGPECGHRRRQRLCRGLQQQRGSRTRLLSAGVCEPVRVVCGRGQRVRVVLLEPVPVQLHLLRRVPCRHLPDRIHVHGLRPRLLVVHVHLGNRVHELPRRQLPVQLAAVRDHVPRGHLCKHDLWDLRGLH